MHCTANSTSVTHVHVTFALSTPIKIYASIFKKASASGGTRCLHCANHKYTTVTH